MSHASPPRPRASRPVRVLAILAVTLAALTACGGDDDGGEATGTTAAETSAPTVETSAPESPTSAEAPAETLSITATEADFSISLDRDDLTAGTYEIQVVNEGDASHDLVVERDGADVAASDMIAPGDSGTVSVTLEPGEYVFYCSIGNHRSMGMEITVQVT